MLKFIATICFWVFAGVVVEVVKDKQKGFEFKKMFILTF